MVQPVPDTPKGTKPPRSTPNGSPGKHRGGGASQPKGGHKLHHPKATPFDIAPLNPPFDTRMRRIGSPLNQSAKIKRGWIQDVDGTKRVNFLFNPSELDLSHSVDPSMPSTQQTGGTDTAGSNPYLASTSSSLSIQLLYDRTYELFSPPKGGKLGFANNYGVWADVAAWYTYLGMLPAFPTSWDDSIITGPPIPVTSWLFIGSKIVYYGWATGISVTYSHFNQEMVPVRAAVSLDFTILPFSGTTPLQGQHTITIGPGGWLGDWTLDPSNPTGATPPDTNPNPFFGPGTGSVFDPNNLTNPGGGPSPIGK